MNIQRQIARPKVTIAIPTLNRVRYLELALKSALGQTYRDIEVLVSNNASTDATASYLDSCTDPRLQVLHQTKLLPMVENWNACVAAATGEYFLLLSDDDLLEPNAIQELVAGYSKPDESHPGPGIVYCGGHIINSVGEISRVFNNSPSLETAQELIKAFLRGERDLWLCAILFRTADILPGFSTAFQVSSDSAMWMSATIRHGDAMFICKDLVRYRIHQNVTLSTPLDVWRRELTELCEFAIEELAKTDRSDPVFAEDLRSITRRLSIQIIPGRINQSFRERKLRALLEYGRKLPCFVSPLGLKVLIVGLASLLLSDNAKTWLRKMRGKQVGIHGERNQW